MSLYGSPLLYFTVTFLNKNRNLYMHGGLPVVGLHGRVFLYMQVNTCMLTFLVIVAMAQT